MPILQALLGAVILLFGHRLFWLLVAIVGFLYGAELAPRLFNIDSQVLILVIALAAGLIGALLAVFAQKLAIAVVGFLLASGLVLQLADPARDATLMQASPGVFIIAVVAGVIGALLALMVFDWVLIILSALYGALMVTASLPLETTWTHIVWIILTVVGIAFQIGLKSRGGTTAAREPAA